MTTPAKHKKMLFVSAFAKGDVLIDMNETAILQSASTAAASVCTTNEFI